MNQIIQVILSVSVLSIPIVSFWIYMAILEKRAKKVIQEHSEKSSEVFSDLKVLFKNFDFSKKRNKFDLDMYQTLYSFNKCDLILNKNNFLVIGKIKVLGKYKPLSPTIFEFEEEKVGSKPRHVKINQIQEVGSDLEIEFIDNFYLNKITLVIKKANKELMQKIKTGYNNASLSNTTKK